MHKNKKFNKELNKSDKNVDLIKKDNKLKDNKEELNGIELFLTLFH